jgi:hypothetical protein
MSVRWWSGLFNGKMNSAYVIICLLRSDMVWPKVITLRITYSNLTSIYFLVDHGASDYHAQLEPSRVLLLAAGHRRLLLQHSGLLHPRRALPGRLGRGLRHIQILPVDCFGHGILLLHQTIDVLSTSFASDILLDGYRVLLRGRTFEQRKKETSIE